MLWTADGAAAAAPIPSALTGVPSVSSTFYKPSWVAVVTMSARSTISSEEAKAGTGEETMKLSHVLQKTEVDYDRADRDHDKRHVSYYGRSHIGADFGTNIGTESNDLDINIFAERYFESPENCYLPSNMALPSSSSRSMQPYRG